MTKQYPDLLDYRRQVADMYAAVRRDSSDKDMQNVWAEFLAQREDLFLFHPQSPLNKAQKAAFSGLSYYDYDPKWRLILPLDRQVKPEIFEIPLQHDGVFRIQRFARVHIMVEGQTIALSLFWVLGYGGGVFLPFRDTTSLDGVTYGGGRYILDTIKSADLGQIGDNLILDFNFAYNPSCAYNARWHCPLPPQENYLPIPIEAGEKVFKGFA